MGDPCAGRGRGGDANGCRELSGYTTLLAMVMHAAQTVVPPSSAAPMQD